VMTFKPSYTKIRLLAPKLLKGDRHTQIHNTTGSYTFSIAIIQSNGPGYVRGSDENAVVPHFIEKCDI
jgi:hypothetical protein